MGADPDTKAVKATLEGDESAFEILVRNYQRPIFALVIRMTGSIDDAPDIVQRVFLNAYAKLKSFRGRSTFKTWLYSIAINLCRNELRHRKRWGHKEQIEEATLSEEAGFDTDLITSEQKKILSSVIEDLPPKQKAVLTLRVYEEMSFKEIAKAVGISENSAKVNFHHAVRHLQEAVKESLKRR